jgi:tetratricopeptide (TPR) repeat protein
MKKKYLILLFFSAVMSLSAQDTIFSGVKELVTLKENRFYIINKKLSKVKYDSVQMKAFARLSKKNNYPQGQIFAYNMLGKINRINTNFSKAIYYHQKAYDIAKRIGDLNMQVYSLNMLGVVYRRMDAVKSALEYHNKALELAQQAPEKTRELVNNIAISHNSIGNIYLLLERDDLAFRHFEKALKIEQQHNNRLGMAINYQNIGAILERQGDLEKALLYFKKSLDYNNQINSKVGKIICNSSIANVYLKQDKIKKAIQTITPNLDLAKELGDNYYLSDVYINVAKIYLADNDLKKTEQYLKKGLKIAKNKNIPSLTSEAYKVFSELKEKVGDYKSALDYHKKYTDETKKVLNEKNRQLVTDVVIRQLQLENKERINELGAENQKVKQKLDRTTKSFYFTLLASLLLLILGFIFYKQYQLNNQRKLMNLEQNLLRAQMNPHFIFNSLNSLKMFIIQNRPKDAVVYLGTFAKLVRTILQSTVDKEMSLKEEIDTIKMYVSIENTRFSNQIQFKINIDENLDIDNIKIPPLFTQPYIENALWHGLSPKEGDKKLEINIYLKQDTHFVIEIIDNGIGRQKAMEIKKTKMFKRASIGIKLSEERLMHFARNFSNQPKISFVDLHDKEGKPAGTKVIIEIPLK